MGDAGAADLTGKDVGLFTNHFLYLVYIIDSKGLYDISIHVCNVL
jgi:hypothetical protein